MRENEFSPLVNCGVSSSRWLLFFTEELRYAILHKTGKAMLILLIRTLGIC